MPVYRYERKLKKSREGRFGFSFDALPDGAYEISKVADWITDLRYGDVLISINQVTTDLQNYVKGQEALSANEWNLVIERTAEHATEGAAQHALEQQCEQVYSQPTPLTTRPRSPSQDGSSLDFSLVSGNGPTLQELAVSKPPLIIWSDAFEISYDKASYIQINYLKFKKKERKREPKIEWILLVQVMHTPAYPYAYSSENNRLQPGDWLLKLDGVDVPFFCEEGTTTWFRNRLLFAQNQPVTITVRRPLTSLAETMDSRDRIESITSIPQSVASPGAAGYEPINPQNAYIGMDSQAQYMLRRPTPPTITTSRNGHGGHVYTPTDVMIAVTVDVPTELTDNPGDLRSEQKILDQCRGNIQLSSIERLGRCRLIFHHASARSSEFTEYIQSEIFGVTSLREVTLFGGFIKEYHVHATISEAGRGFSQPTRESCISPMQTCSFEMHETHERVREKFGVSKSSRSLSTLPDHLNSGPVSIRDLKRCISTTPDDVKPNQMHLEVLSLTGPSAASCKTWCSPILYCKHSINIIFTDVSELFMGHSEIQISRTLADISAHSNRDLNTSDTNDSTAVGSKVLLLIQVDPDRYSYAEVKQLVDRKFHAYRSMLIIADGCPFIPATSIQAIRQVLLKELKDISEIRSKYNYPHAGVMFSQELKSSSVEVLDTDDLRRRLRGSIVQEADNQTDRLQAMEEGTMQYLQNTGLAYIPKLSYVTSIGRGSGNVRHSMLIRPHRLVNYIVQLMQQNPGERGRATDADWAQCIHLIHSNKLVGMLREIHVILDEYNLESGDDHMTVLPLARPNTIRQHPSNRNPDLLLKYKRGLNFLLVTAFLNYLSSKSVSSNVDYHSSCGIFDISDHSVQVYRTTNTHFGWRFQQPVATTDQSLSFFVDSTSPEKMSKKGFTAHMKQLILKFHTAPSWAKDKPLFGPPCPQEERCSNFPFHVIDLLDRVRLSCSGVSLERIDSVVDYVTDARYENTPDKAAKRAAVLNKPASSLPMRLIEQLDEHSALSRNWVGLARLENLSGQDIERLEATGTPAYTLLRELSTHQGLTIENLFKMLVTMEMDSLTHSISDWIDLEITR